MSSMSLLRKSSEIGFKPNPPPSPQSMDGSSSSLNKQNGMKRASSQKAAQTPQRVPTRRQSTMSIDTLDLSQFQSKDQKNEFGNKSPLLASCIQQNNNSSPPATIDRKELLSHPSITIVDSNEYESEEDLFTSANSNRPEVIEESTEAVNIPLFEHFLVIGVSVDVSYLFFVCFCSNFYFFFSSLIFRYIFIILDHTHKVIN